MMQSSHATTQEGPCDGTASNRAEGIAAQLGTTARNGHRQAGAERGSEHEPVRPVAPGPRTPLAAVKPRVEL